jgi:hypothetical protein
MTVDYRIEDAKPYHVGRMARAMRAGHRQSLLTIGAKVHGELLSVFRASGVRRSCFIGDRLVAMWGLIGSLASSSAYVWMAVSPEATMHTLELLREAQRQMADFNETRGEIEATILAGDAPALHFAVFLGFLPRHPETGEIGNIGSGTVRERGAALRRAEHYWHRVNGGHAIAMVYRKRDA